MTASPGHVRPCATGAAVLLASVAWLAAGGARAAPPNPARTDRGPTDTAASLYAAVRSVGLGEVRWTGGFWKARLDTCRTATVPHLWQIMKGTEYSQFLENFRIAAGRSEGRHRGAAFNDGELYKWVEAAS